MTPKAAPKKVIEVILAEVSPGPLRLVLEMPGKLPTTPEKEFYLLGTLPSFLDGAAPSMQGPLSNWALMLRIKSNQILREEKSMNQFKSSGMSNNQSQMGLEVRMDINDNLEVNKITQSKSMKSNLAIKNQSLK
ncbi:hypothetical protein O181_126184 [Austropuccinia psidii MF-1]|uniref:Uncharacterized protein n=1 Tax=Austropuccinia psidii MF-1 TaxID=1389203 RepID=A0A9Q3KSV3_9BASI|nr:hypothetical protein [Austropuccinia psidii MF-1]